MKTPSVALLLILAAAFLLVGCSDNPAPVVGPNNTRAGSVTDLSKAGASGQLIAFASDQGTEYFNVFTMKSNGKEVTQLTFGTGVEFYGRPDWSPDRSQMTLTTVLYERGLVAQIYVMDADGSNPKWLNTPGSSDASRWSPDGKWITFQMWDGSGRQQVYIIKPDGSGLSRVTNDPNGAKWPTWAPDSWRIAYTSYSDNQIHIINSDGTGDAALTSGMLQAEYPAWSLRGDVILFVNRNSSTWGDQDIWSVKADGSGLTRLTNSSFYDDQPRWSPSSTQIVFVSNRDGDPGHVEIYTMNANGTHVNRLTDHPTWWDADVAW